MMKTPNNVHTYAFQSKDNVTREKSSSGGAFSEFAKTVFNAGGIVVGCRFNPDFESAEHILISDYSDIDLLRGSKYIQSSMHDLYIQIKEKLENNIPVLFVGTPCQVGGLKSFIEVSECKNQRNLFTIDFICHGVPSHFAFKRYLECQNKRYRDTLQHVFFRSKKYGWHLYSLVIKYKNSEYAAKATEDPYLRGFVSNLYLRPSCSKCSFKGENYSSDITIADFWGLNQAVDGMDDDKGTSLIIIHTESGQAHFNEIKESGMCIEVPFSIALKSNISYFKPVKPNMWRSYFFSRMNRTSFNDLVLKIVDNSFSSRIFRYIYKIAFRKNG